MKRFRWLAGDLNWLDYGGMWYRKTDCCKYHVIKLVNLEDAGEPIDGNRYAVELGEVDLEVADIDAAAKCCGLDDPHSASELALVQVVAEYGQMAPFGEWVGNNARDLLKQARKRSLELDDPDEYHEAMDKPVNKIGSTAREYQMGDFFSAIVRGLEQGNKDAWILAKMHGNSDQDLENAGYTNPFKEPATP